MVVSPGNASKHIRMKFKESLINSQHKDIEARILCRVRRAHH